jgi:hypothetical protein
MNNRAFGDRVDVPFSTKGYGVLMDRDVEVIGSDARNLRSDHGAVGAGPNIDWGKFRRCGGSQVVHHAIHILLHESHLPKWIERAPRISWIGEHLPTPFTDVEGIVATLRRIGTDDRQLFRDLSALGHDQNTDRPSAETGSPPKVSPEGMIVPACKKGRAGA